MQYLPIPRIILSPTALEIKRCIVNASLALAFIPGLTWAFAPGGYYQFPGAKTHVVITEEAMQTIYAELKLAKVSKSMKEARKQITDANREVDQDQFSSAKHVDAENFSGAQLFINSNLADVVTKVRANDAAGARTSLGTALFRFPLWQQAQRRWLYPMLFS
jgi:hypothetical protein